MSKGSAAAKLQEQSHTPFLRWAGSKRKLLPKLHAIAPEQFNRYVEPFAGSACFFFSLAPSSAVLGDINCELINAFLAVRDDCNNLTAKLGEFHRCKETYYNLRAQDPLNLSPVTRAARFIYLNRFCFNGLYRTNQKGQFNVPWGGERSGQLPSAERLQNCSRALQNVIFQNGPFEETLKHAKAGDFVYMDPPYAIRSRRVFNEYSNAVFDDEDLMSLRNSLLLLDKNGVKFLVSYGYSREALVLGNGFNCRSSMVQRQIAGFAANRRKSKELMITNY